MTDSSEIDAIIKALAHPVRRQILAWLKDPEEWFAEQAHPLDYGVCAGMIDKRTGLSQSTTSAHLSTLQKAGLVETQRIGQWIYYKRNEANIQAFLEAIGESL
ncbi:ArsR/SmtB family transcription factor [Marinobacterium mangrovicola]|uniref:ArsR family transcriptional regulator n=1 Tax=Marinobacterium mangrovicola TaxID=1476959 RepID=A0A4R1GIQ4_9GAMM|nr:helix-turn-helix transcriptional regulator [Marinobacterium mangrovicola]TCK08187.1 ArsR family transcriptional regulator [Marinobacterium mangrovicola]